jgi:hypothetical protein
MEPTNIARKGRRMTPETLRRAMVERKEGRERKERKEGQGQARVTQ